VVIHGPYVLARLDRDGYTELAAQAHPANDQIFGAKQQAVGSGPCD
jgi:hypothetical protein